MNVEAVPVLGWSANTRCAGRYHQLVLSAARTSPCYVANEFASSRMARYDGW